MMHFSSCRAFGRFLEQAAAQIPQAQTHGLAKASEIMQREAKAEIGTYAQAAGPFPTWDPLSQATLDGFHHPKAGWIPGKLESYPEDPLLRQGVMRDSIEAAHDSHNAVVGSNDDVALWQEMGTPGAMFPIPPRSFLGRSLFVTQDAAASAIMRRVLTPMVGAPLALQLTPKTGFHHE
jgi:phage gpG-like protein